MIQFHAADHTYWHEGKRVLGVTSILKVLGGYEWVNDEVLERKSQVGTAVHLATELDDKGDLVPESVHPIIQPYLEAWRKFRRECGFIPTLMEQKVWHPHLNFAGTLDRVGAMQDSEWVIDIKATAQISPNGGPQTAAYAMAANLPLARRAAVQLLDSGNYRLHEFSDSADIDIFLACHRITTWKDNHANQH